MIRAGTQAVVAIDPTTHKVGHNIVPSTTQVFTGQTMGRNGGATARIAHRIAVS